MKTSISPSYGWAGALSLILVGLTVLGPTDSVAQTGYSYHAAPVNNTEYRVTTGGGCVGCTVENPERAADLSPSSAATMSTPLGVGSAYLNLRLKLNATVPGGSVAGVAVGSSSTLLDLVTLSRVRIRTYRGSTTGAPNPTLVETRSGVSAVEVRVIGQNQYVIEFATTPGAAFDFNQVELGMGGLNDAFSSLNVFYAYGIPQGTTPLGPAFTSTFPSPANGADYQASTTGICVLCGVTNPARAADENLNTGNYATIQTTIGALGDSRLRLRINGEAPAGSVAGFVVSTGSLIDVALLSTITIRTYTRDGNGNLILRETASGGGLLQLNLLTGNRYSLGFVSTEPFEYVEIAVGGLATVANTLQVYYAFGVPPVDSPLPVSLTDFKARAQASGVQLTWSTASEQHSAAFVVERALDPKAGFRAVGQPVPAAGTTFIPQHYTLFDANAPASTLYYRLRQLDVSGEGHFSEVVVVRASKAPAEPTWQLWPNPARGYLQVSLNGVSTTGAALHPATRLILHDGVGRLVGDYPLNKAETRLELGQLPPGRYLARVANYPRSAVAIVIE